MVDFEIVGEAKYKDFGRNNFIEIARKKVVYGEGSDGQEFISISRGYYASDKTKRYNKSLTIPDENDVKDFIAEFIKST